MKQLSIPPPPWRRPEMLWEIARVRIADSRRHLTLQTRAWEDPAAWGLMLVDLARHVANAYEQLEGRARAEVLTRIRQCFDAERESPTDQPTGTVG